MHDHLPRPGSLWEYSNSGELGIVIGAVPRSERDWGTYIELVYVNVRGVMCCDVFLVSTFDGFGGKSWVQV